VGTGFLMLNAGNDTITLVDEFSDMDSVSQNVRPILFFLCCNPFGIWLWLDQNWDLIDMLKDVAKRPFITMGFMSFVLLLPLALTSNHWAQRKLGRRWGKLHRIIYLIGVAAILHYWWHKASKNDLETVSIYAGVMLLLLCCRIPSIRKLISFNFKNHASNS